jgi:ligand-binding sensor domain-containing protein/signal transduction histidine kinase
MRLERRFAASLTSWWGCWLLVAALARAAPAQSLLDSWTTENGLPQNSINDIVQSRDGYLWLATYGGLVRFDGIRFVVFDRSVDGILSQRFRCLLEDRDGTLWATTEEGLLIRYRNGRFTTFGHAEGLPQANVIRMEEGDDGQIWITSLSSMTRFDGWRAVTYRSSDFAPGFRLPPAQHLTDLWWSIDEGTLQVIVAGKVQAIALPASHPGRAVSGVTRDKSGNFWIRTRDGVLRHGPEETRQYGSREGLPFDGPFIAFHEGANGELWCALGEAIYRIRKGTREHVADGGLLTLFNDREGSTWLGTSAGLHRVRDFSFTTYSQRHGLSANWVYSILQDRHGTVWIGTWGGGLNRFDRGRFTTLREADGLPSDYITATYEDVTGRLWIGTTNGIGYIENGRLHRYSDSSGLLSGEVWAIRRDREGALWFGSSSGLVRLAGGRFSRFTTKDGLSHDRITSLFEDRAGSIWIGSLQGLTRFRNGRFTAYGEPEGLIGTHVRAIHEDPDGILWLGTYDGGLYRLAGDRLTRFTPNAGLHDSGVFQILEDGGGHFWMGSNRGISRVSRHELNDVADGRRQSVAAIVFGAKDGLASVEVNGGRQPSGLKAADGRFWFPTMGGIAIVDPAALRVNTSPPAAVVEEVRVAGRTVDPARPVTLPSATATLEIRYTAPSFVKPDQVRFRYRLEGLDDRWIDAGDARTTMFHRIPPGAYRFMVVASNHHHVWNTTGPLLNIVVLGPFWRTWWFMTLAAASLVSIAMAGHWRRVRRLRREHALQAAFSQQLIDSQENERRRISSEMHDSLGQHLAIIRQRARTGLEAGPEYDSRTTLEEIVAVAGQIDAEVKDIAYGLRPYQLDRLGLSKTIRAMVQRIGDSCGIACAADIAPIDRACAESTHIHVFRIVQEAMNNIVKHSQATRAMVTVARDGGSIVVRIEDNGTGVRLEATGVDRPANGGLGLAGIRERARILGGTVEIRSYAGAGTSLTVTFPAKATPHD